MSGSPLAKVPMLRILIPFAAGVLMGNAVPWCTMKIALIVAVLALLLAAVLRWRCSAMQRSKLTIIPLTLLSLSLGALDAWISAPPDLGDKYADRQPMMGVVESVKQNDASTGLMVQTGKAGVVSLIIDGNHYGYAVGDVVAFRPNLTRIENLGNPYEFDYAGYMRHKSSAYKQFVANASTVAVIGHSRSPYFFLQRIRITMRHRVLESRISPQTKTLINAILLGYGTDIDPEFRQNMSKAGVAHIVALSGLHVSLVGVMFSWLLMPAFRGGRLKWCVTVVALAVIAFAVFTGLSPSVSRSALMTTFAAMAIVTNRRTVSLNSLACAATLILLLSPNSLYDVGFMLSFATVTMLLLVSEPLTSVLKNKNRVLRYVAFSVCVSVVSMIATSALTAYYFHSVSVLAFIANLVVLPFLPVYMLLAFVYVMLLWAWVDVPLIAELLNAITALFSGFVEKLGACEISHIDNVWLTPVEVWLGYVSVAAFASVLFVKRKVWAIIAGLATATIGLALHAALAYITPSEGLIIFNAYKSTPILYFANHKGYLWCPDRREDAEDFFSSHRALLSRMRIDAVEPIDSPCSIDGNLFQKNYAIVMNRKIVAIGGVGAVRKDGLSAIDWDYAIALRTYPDGLPWRKIGIRSRCVVISGDVWQEKLDGLKCDLIKNSTPYHSLSESGAIAIYR